jgi:hypothetical protein
MRTSVQTAEVLGETNVCFEFHIPEFQRNIGENFKPERFSQRLREANTDNVLFEAKCAYGHAYYDTAIDNQHPNVDFDFYGAIHDACHDADMEVHTYYCLVYDNVSGVGNPDWYQRDGDGTKLEAPELGDVNTWDYLCLNSPYTEEVVFPQVAELLEGYDIDALFFDILLYHEDACTCQYCKETMRERGMEPDDPDDRARHRQWVCERFAERMTRFIKDRDEDVVVTYNHPLGLGLTTELADHMDYVLIESLPAGWGYLHTPISARYSRNLDRPVQGMTGIFHQVWGDYGSVKHENQLRYELATSMLHHLPVSVGDQLLPQGELMDARYDVIGDAFEFRKERSLPAADPVRDVAVVYPGAYDPGRSGEIEDLRPAENGVTGAAKLLLDTHQQFDVLDERLAQELLTEFQVAVLPDTGALEPETVETVRSFVDDGGSLVATATSSLDSDGFALADVLGVAYEGRLPYSTAYVRLDEPVDGVPDIDCVTYGPVQSVHATTADATAQVVRPVTERSETRRYSHFQAPPAAALDVPAITTNEFGDGQARYVGTNLFTQYYAQDYHAHRALLDDVVTSVQTDRRLAADAPTSVEVNAMRSGNDVFVHLTNQHTYRTGGTIPQIDDIPTLSDVSVTAYAPGLSEATAVTDADVSVEQAGEYVTITFDDVGIHEAVRLH